MTFILGFGTSDSSPNLAAGHRKEVMSGGWYCFVVVCAFVVLFIPELTFETPYDKLMLDVRGAIPNVF